MTGRCQTGECPRLVAEHGDQRLQTDTHSRCNTPTRRPNDLPRASCGGQRALTRESGSGPILARGVHRQPPVPRTDLPAQKQTGDIGKGSSGCSAGPTRAALQAVTRFPSAAARCSTGRFHFSASSSNRSACLAVPEPDSRASENVDGFVQQMVQKGPAVGGRCLLVVGHRSDSGNALASVPKVLVWCRL